MKNPFDKSISLNPELFIGRQREIWQALGRLARPGLPRESSAIIGESGLGKSWFLKRLKQPDLIAEYELEKSAFLYLDCDGVELDNFWHIVFQKFKDAGTDSGDMALVQEILALDKIDTLSIRPVFKHLSRNQRFIVMLLDNFEAIIAQEDSEQPTFLDNLRSLLIDSHNSLAAVLGVRKPLEELSLGFEFVASPFNVFYPIELPPFTEKETEKFIMTRLKNTAVEFPEVAIKDLHRITGGHPQKLRQACFDLFETRKKDLSHGE